MLKSFGLYDDGSEQYLLIIDPSTGEAQRFEIEYHQIISLIADGADIIDRYKDRIAGDLL